MAKLNGFAVLMSVGTETATKIPGQTESSITFTAATEDVTTKDDVKDGKLTPVEDVTNTQAELTCTCYAEETETFDIKIGTIVKWAFTGITGNHSGEGLVINIVDSGSVQGKATVQVTVKSRGEIVTA